MTTQATLCMSGLIECTLTSGGRCLIDRVTVASIIDHGKWREIICPAIQQRYAVQDDYESLAKPIRENRRWEFYEKPTHRESVEARIGGPPPRPDERGTDMRPENPPRERTP